jgi:hypothetical protein
MDLGLSKQAALKLAESLGFKFRVDGPTGLPQSIVDESGVTINTGFSNWFEAFQFIQGVSWGMSRYSALYNQKWDREK